MTEYSYVASTEAFLPRIVFDIIPPITVSTGMIGNILCLFVLNRKQFSQLSVSVYLRGLAIADFLSLLVSNSLHGLIEKLINYQIRNSNSWACKIFIWMHSSFPWISSWLVVAISIERVIVVNLPHKAKMLCTSGKAKLVTAFIYTFLILCQSHTLFEYAIHDNACLPVAQPKTYYISLIWIAITFYAVLPLLIITICNICIITTIVKVKRLHRSIAHPPTEKGSNLTFMLVTNCFFFLLLTVPYDILILIYPNFIPKNNIAGYAINISYELRIFNHAINFILYVICGSVFRRELLLMLRCKRKEPIAQPTTSIAHEVQEDRF